MALSRDFGYRQEELDRREQQIVDLQASNEDLSETIETLKSELISNNEECERLHTQVEQLRLRADDSAKASLDESSARETQLREVVEDLEKCRLEREDWENQAMKERVERETLETSLNSAERELSQLRHEKQVLKNERDREAESAANLHNVLEEFQAAKDKELRATLGDLQTQLQTTSRSMQEYKQKAQLAEMKLAESHSDSERCISLQKEVKEKNMFIGKLRHEGKAGSALPSTFWADRPYSGDPERALDGSLAASEEGHLGKQRRSTLGDQRPYNVLQHASSGQQEVRDAFPFSIYIILVR